jgi:hypothetical protein
MKQMAYVRSNESGSALLVVMILVFSMGIVGSAFFSLVGHEIRASHANLNSQQAFWLAEGAKERAIVYLSNMYSPPTTDFYIYQDMGNMDGGTYTVHCIVDTTVQWDVEKAFVLDCVGNSGDVERRVRQRVRMTSFALYAMFTNDETIDGNPIWHITGDLIEGPLHTNGSFSIYGTPQFLGKVTSASDHMTSYPDFRVTEMSDWPVGGNNPYFAEGGEMKVAPIPLPTETVDLRDLSFFGGVYTENKTDIELGVMGTDDGIVAPGWLRHKDHSAGPDDWISVQIASLSNKVFYCNNAIYLKGILDGELTISSRKSIRIKDDVTYFASDAQGTPLPGCDDLLGLVAERNIVFLDNSANRNDLIVNGVLMALNTSIKVQNYDEGSPRGILTIWGGLIQKDRGPVGMFQGGSVVHGYLKNYHYDPRVTARTPPFFPQTGIYEEMAWEETWDDSDPF